MNLDELSGARRTYPSGDMVERREQQQMVSQEGRVHVRDETSPAGRRLECDRVERDERLVRDLYHDRADCSKCRLDLHRCPLLGLEQVEDIDTHL